MPTRRVVTGNDARGKSYFVFDGPTPGHLDAGVFQTDEIWVDDPAQPDPDARRDPVDVHRHHLMPPVGGSTVRIFTFPPQAEMSEITPELVERVRARFDTGDAMEEDNPGMHTTPTIDYGIILSGEIDLEVDAGEVHLQAGDVVVQRATRHAWRNRGDRLCNVAFILISSPNYR
ncbi:MAG TPA: cupin domain-containing protein [Gammaproteobacteria bacterium]|nr:cupin domain-containing protein [Gammaproteobacteria bacterium]